MSDEWVAPGGGLKMDCPQCDGFGAIDGPSGLMKCTGCETPPAFCFLPLAALVGPPEDGDREWYGAQESKRKAAVRADEDAVLEHALSAPPGCGCRWCTVQPMK